ncbi:hypothetical protein SAMN05421595_1314 [Austwickia chelonae]|uniref:WXG100 family type VII secretion target n=1 Tax=Austwickia chelonae NBRC 105200 TaxID=1184607 RepID=K6V5H6_9MICO|nr:hypothetical protein [Austwickia chelonae]GAB77478.1 hypothetical protein AUCHE_05_03900 [Austwickia chelonae NBRC 105200]SEW11215.1 hypothetical protein SAMN05421595_1314 [Austwickia chelonae]
MAGIDTRVFGDPSACFAACRSIEDHRKRVANAADDVSKVRVTLAGSWTGMAADGFSKRAKEHIENLDQLTKDLRTTCDALNAFATTLRDVQLGFEDLRKKAISYGLAVGTNEIKLPAPPTDSTKIAYQMLEDKAIELRERESNAHNQLQDIISPLTDRTGLVWFFDKASIIPPDSDDPIKKSLYAGQAFNNMPSWISGWKKEVLRRFRPRWPKGSSMGSPGAFRKIGEMSSWEKIRSACSDKNFTKPAAKWTKVGTATGITGGVLNGAAGAYDQWTKDSDDPGMSTGKKVRRATALGALTGGGAYLGASGGAKGGAAIGLVLGGPPGAAIGAIGGGIIGGVAGSAVGEGIGKFATGLLK